MLDLLMLCSLFAVLLDGTRGFSVDLPQQMRSMVKQCSSCTEHPNFYSTNHKKLCKTSFYSSKDDNENLVMTKSPMQIIHDTMLLNPTKSIYFSLSIILCGAALGPLLDSYHSLFGVLTYNNPVIVPIILDGGDRSMQLLTCVTTYWVPPLFGLAGFLIGWIYILLDASMSKTNQSLSSKLNPTTPKVLIGVAYFTFQYWFSGVLFVNHVDRTIILLTMSVLAAGGYYVFDRTKSGFITSAATAIGGPLIEVGLISFLPDAWAYHYNDAGETGYFPLWIVPVYFLGGPANGNLARAIWNVLGRINDKNDSKAFPDSQKQTPCPECNGTRAISCPNCDDGTYVTYGERVICKACRGKGRVICRTCFSQYGNDPNDIEGIRQLMDKIPD
jgi:hypothetical protein